MFAYVCMCLVSLGIEKNRLVMDSERGVSLVDTQVWKGKKISVLCLLKTLFCAETLSPKTLILTILIFFKKLTLGETLSCGVVQKGSSFLFPLVFVDCPQVRQSPPLPLFQFIFYFLEHPQLGLGFLISFWLPLLDKWPQ